MEEEGIGVRPGREWKRRALEYLLRGPGATPVTLENDSYCNQIFLYFESTLKVDLVKGKLRKNGKLSYCLL